MSLSYMNLQMKLTAVVINSSPVSQDSMLVWFYSISAWIT